MWVGGEGERGELFWCGATRSLAAVIDADKADLSPTDAAAFAVRNLPDAVEVFESIERRWPGTLKTYRDEKGLSLLQKSEQELIFGAWRWFLGNIPNGTLRP